MGASCMGKVSSCGCNSIKKTINNKKVSLVNGIKNTYKYISERIDPDIGLVGLGSKPSTIVDPTFFKIKRYYESGDYLLIHVVYPNCKNFEGNKYILYKNVKLIDILQLDVLDPHFCESDKHPTPLARFEPTPHGWLVAVELISHLIEEKL